MVLGNNLKVIAFCVVIALVCPGIDGGKKAIELDDKTFEHQTQAASGEWCLNLGLNVRLWSLM